MSQHVFPFVNRRNKQKLPAPILVVSTTRQLILNLKFILNKRSVLRLIFGLLEIYFIFYATLRLVHAKNPNCIHKATLDVTISNIGKANATQVFYLTQFLRTKLSWTLVTSEVH